MLLGEREYRPWVMNAFLNQLGKGIFVSSDSSRGRMGFSKLPFFALANHKTKERAPLKMSLNFKLLSIIVGVLLIGVVSSSFLVLNLQRQQFIAPFEFCQHEVRELALLNIAWMRLIAGTRS